MAGQRLLEMRRLQICKFVDAWSFPADIAAPNATADNVSFTLPLVGVSPTSSEVTQGSDEEEVVATTGGMSVNQARRILLTHVLAVICVLGLIGNILNLMVLIPKGARSCAMGRIEKFAYSGLTALAISDAFFCLAATPSAFTTPLPLYDSLTFTLYYQVYSNAAINMFITSSTWLTVTLAVGRYVAICHPLRARELIGMTVARRSMVVIFSTCILFNIPRFWTYTFASVTCRGGVTYYIVHDGALKENDLYWNVYQWLYFALGIALPFLLMLFCNAHLIRALNMSRRTRNSLRVQTATSHSISGATRHITRTLIAIVVMYLILVSPAELITFFRPTNFATKNRQDVYNLAIAIVNTFQAINFSFSFTLYCVINVHFRRAVVDVMSCNVTCANAARRRPEMTYSNVQSTALNSSVNGAIELG